jgi:hypothetical protein
MQVIQVTRFDFTNQLHALLTDYVLCENLDNLDVNLVDPFAKYAPPSGQLPTVNSGAIFQPGLHKLLQESKQFPCWDNFCM